MATYIGIGFFVVIILLFVKFSKKANAPQPVPASNNIEDLLSKHVSFYQRLSSGQQESFSKRVSQFLSATRITPVGNVQLTDLDKVYIGASAIIPIFHFPEWQYTNLDEVLVYPGSFDEGFQQHSKDRNVLGMVGDGALNRQMILSQESLRQGYEQKNAGNTGIHEFVHLLDKSDGATDGLPEFFMPSSLKDPWLKQVHRAIAEIRQKGDDINPYAGTNEAEFLAVISEYFFTKPVLLEQHHPEIYQMLQTMFRKKDGQGK
ncbi:M90 family metallopeptidase [Pollutibacter soli]|uniref:M90 family metallopeptidase n=1 Tax=Pollutibacter soli TaxID=3034157 RepID=UPI0030132939